MCLGTSVRCCGLPQSLSSRPRNLSKSRGGAGCNPPSMPRSCMYEDLYLPFRFQDDQRLAVVTQQQKIDESLRAFLKVRTETFDVLRLQHDVRLKNDIRGTALLSSKKRQPAASSSRLILILAVASLRSTNAHPPRKFSHHCAFGINPTVNPNNRPIFPKVSSVGFAVPASISATWRLVSDSVLANSSCVKPSPLRISTTASGNLKSPVRARSASVRRFSRISSFVGFLHRAI